MHFATSIIAWSGLHAVQSQKGFNAPLGITLNLSFNVGELCLYVIIIILIVPVILVFGYIGEESQYIFINGLIIFGNGCDIAGNMEVDL